MLKLRIPNAIFIELVEHARSNAPIEACGILAGRGRTVERFYPMTNTDASSDHFLMDPAEQFAVVKDMRAAGLEMLAVYHSHPQTPARPSQEDMRLALTPGVLYVILSLQEPARPVLKGYAIENGRADEVLFECTDGSIVQRIAITAADPGGGIL